MSPYLKKGEMAEETVQRLRLQIALAEGLIWFLASTSDGSQLPLTPFAGDLMALASLDSCAQVQCVHTETHLST